MPSYIEEDIESAIAAYRRGNYASISHTSAIFNIPPSTLLDYLRKAKIRKQSYEKQQLLSTIKEEELVAWITNASKLGVLMLLPLIRNLTKEIQAN